MTTHLGRQFTVRRLLVVRGRCEVTKVGGQLSRQQEALANAAERARANSGPSLFPHD